MLPRTTFILVLFCGVAALETSIRENAALQIDLDSKADIAQVEVPKVEVPKVEHKEVFAVPTSSRCVVILTVQYMIIYTALAIARTYLEFFYSPPLVTYKTRGLVAATQAMSYAPMLCVLFIACRMRVEFLSGGQGEPQAWVQACMYALTFAVFTSALVVLLMPLFSGKQVAMKEDAPDMEIPQVSPRFETETKSKIVFYTLTILRYMIMLGLYGGIAGVIVGTNIYLPPGHSDLSKLPTAAPAVTCTMVLAVVFFVTQLIIVVCQTYTEFAGINFYAGHVHKAVQVMTGAASTVDFAPMISIVFLAARMRALQHDGQPQEWAQHCMYAATGALCLTTLLAIVVPYALGGEMKRFSPTTNEVTFEVPNRALGYVMVALRFTCLICVYGGVGAVIYSIFAFEAPDGRVTEPVSPTVHCVVSLACQFFVIYGGLMCCVTISEISGGRLPLETYKFYTAFEAAKATLPFAPMLAILFVTTRMYALLITDKQGAPQAWVQDGMYMATWSLLISFATCLVAGVVLDTVKTDADGNLTNEFSNTWISAAMTTLRYFTMLLLYGGITIVIVGLFLMTPENANGRGSIPVVSDAVRAAPFPVPRF